MKTLKKTQKRKAVSPKRKVKVTQEIYPFGMASLSYLRPQRYTPPSPTWTDAYGNTRTAQEMTDDHLWNVAGYLIERVRRTNGMFPSSLSFLSKMRLHAPFFFEAIKELKRRGIMP